MNAQCLFRVSRQLPCDLVGQIRIDAAHLVQRRELDLLAVRVVLELEPLLIDLGGDQLVLRRDRDELARGHGEGASREPGEPGQHDGVSLQAAAADPGDQRDVGDQSVHGAEHRRPQPATRHVPVLVHVRLTGLVAAGAGAGAWLCLRLGSGLAGCHPGSPCFGRLMGWCGAD